MKSIGKNPITERHQFLLNLTHLGELPRHLSLPSRYFGLFLACDGRVASDEAVVEAARSLLDEGLVYLCSWGPECERVHDLFDSVIVERDPNETEKSVTLTSWHDDESLDEALWYFLNAAFPTDDYREGCQAELIAVVSNEAWAGQVKARLADPQSLNRDVVGEDEVDAEPAA